MKKVLALLLVLVLAVGTFAACGGGKSSTSEPASVESTPEVSPAEPPSSEPASTDPAVSVVDHMAGDTSGVRTGLGVVTNMKSSMDADAEGDGVGQVDSLVAAVLIDNDGRVLNVKIDSAQSKLSFTVEGKLVTPADTVFQSKHELGDAYGMRVASGIGKEWNEQADALEAFVIGKTADEIRGLALDPNGVPTDADLAAGVTIKIGSYTEAVLKAIDGAKARGAAEGDTLGLGLVTTGDQSKDATADADGLAQAYSTYVAVTVNPDGLITSAVVDASQGNVSFDATGVITSDKATKASKRELGDDYNMRGASPIGKEWFEQAEAFATYITGKTLAEVSGTAVTDGTPTDADLVASVTMTITDMVAATEKAYNNASVAAVSPALESEPVAEVSVAA